MSGWRFAAKTHVGLVRDGNEDALYAGPRLLAVADGVGGSVAGEIASKITISTLSPLDTDATITDPLDALRDATQEADIQLRDAIAGDPGLSGMGTTLTAVLWAGDQVGLAQLGDSRAYLMRDGELTQLTRDQTLVQSLVDEGQITAEEALVHPRRSWILRALDGRGEAEPDVQLLEPVAGDRYLLCSDGLSDYVKVDTIATTLQTSGDLQLVCDALVDHALAAGAPDNVTCVLAEPVDGDPPTTRPVIGGAATAPDRGRSAAPPTASSSGGGRTRTRSVGRRLTLVAVIILLLVAAAIAATTLYVRSQWYLAEDNGYVAIYHGERGKAAGLSLSRLASRTDLPISAVVQADQDLLRSGQVSGRSKVDSEYTRVRGDACDQWTAAHPPKPTVAKHRKTTKRQPRPTTRQTPPSWCPQQP
ncbi:MAG TPA: PP2C family serine/threonine-protein phosphatase [Mycobacteriales bacterium]|nr:PP2C family serine/threonine-protein phosphatase [Mycobacteriales bacterium]